MPGGGAEPVPAWWTDRQPGETITGWVIRMQLLYRITRLTQPQEGTAA